MKILAFIATVPLLAACSLTPRNNEQLAIDTNPAGAEVVVLGESMGLTPLQLPVTRIFPAVYPPEKQSLYGRVVLRKEGCSERIEAVSTRAMASGLHVKLDCGAAPNPGEPDLRTRLKRLDDLRRDGTISPEEYATQRQRILGEL